MVKLEIRETIVPINIEKCEAHYNAKFVGDFCIKGKHGWLNTPCAIFYQPNPPLDYSNYMALTVDEYDRLLIMSGLTAVEEPIPAVKCLSTGEVIWSRYRNDMRWSKDGSVAIDGGRDYSKIGGSRGSYEIVELIIKDGEVFVNEDVKNE